MERRREGEREGERERERERERSFHYPVITNGLKGMLKDKKRLPNWSRRGDSYRTGLPR